MPDPTNYWSYLDHTDPGQTLTNAYQGQIALNLQRAQMQRQLAQQAQSDQIRQTLLAPGGMTPQNFAAYTIANPDAAAAIKDAHDQMDTDTRNSEIRFTSALNGYLAAGQPDQAAALAQQRIDADRAAGVDTSTHQQVLNLIQTDPKSAQILTGTALAALAGTQPGTNYAAAAPELDANARANVAAPLVNAKTVADTNLANVQAQVALHPPPKSAAVAGMLNPDGSPVLYNPDAAPPPQPLAPGLQGFVSRLLPSENSTGNPGAQNPLSSATGNGQFLNGTWLNLIKNYRPDLAQGKSDADILALRSNPDLSAQMVAQYASANANALQTAGPGGTPIPVNGTTLAAAHKLGPQNAAAVLSADATTPLTSILSKQVIAANPQLAKLTAGQYVAGLAQTFGTDPIQVGPDDGTLTGDDYLKTLPPQKARQIVALANGDATMPTGRAAATGAGQQLMQQVLQYDPTASATNLATRLATRKAFTTGTEPPAISIGAANTLVGHLVSLNAAIDALHNTPSGLINAPAQVLGQALGNQDTQKAVADFNTYKGLVANEAVKVLRGGSGSEADIKFWQDQLDSAKSPVALHATVNSIISAMQSRLQALGYQYSQGMGKVVDGISLLNPHAQAMLKTLGVDPGDQTVGAGGGAAAGQSAPQYAVNPQTGQRLVLDSRTNTWKPG